jgi:polyphosphate kinase
MNALVDQPVIEALYRASQAGVPITLLVRGICCLRPGVPRVSETIEVRALIDRFLEHGRAFTSSTAARTRFTSRAPIGCPAIFIVGSKR